MKSQRIFILLLLLLLATTLAGCSPGHVGGNEIAFLRDGHLWTIDPDGSNAFQVFADDTTPVVGYGWSPNHQILTFRTLDVAFAKTPQAKHLISHPVTEAVGDLPSTLNTIGIDGGSPIPLIFSTPTLRNSNAWWNTTGNRLLYREETLMAVHSPDTVLWWVSQNDQPGGIARKLLPYSLPIPSLSPDSSLVAGISQQGLFTSMPNGTNLKYIVHGKLPGHPLFATLERALWQPAHAQPALLYALESPAHAEISSADAITVQLVLNDLHGHLTTLTSCACTQFAWAPDGNHILYSAGSTFTIYYLSDSSSFSFSAEDGSVPYWSPDSQFLLLDGPHTLALIEVKNRQQQLLLRDANTASISTPASQPAPTANVNDLLQPVANNVWAADNRHFLFSTRGRLFWQGKPLSSGRGLYTVDVDNKGQLQGPPVLIDTGRDIQAGWSYEDPNTSFLF